MLASLLVAALAAAPSPPPEKATMAVVITGHDGLAFDEALELARRLTRALGLAGAPEPMDPQLTVTKLGGKNPEACGARSACLADLARALHVSSLVTMDGGKVVGDIALAVALVDGRDGRKLLERTSAAPPAHLDAALLPLAAELARVASALPGPSALDAPYRSTRPDLERPPLNFGVPAVLVGGGAVVSGGVALGFAGAALWQLIDLSLHTVSGPGVPPGYQYQILYPAAEYDLRRAELDRRLTISLCAGIGSAVLTGAAAFLLLQPPAR